MSSITDLLRQPAADQLARGYLHTLREICQQPDTWEATAQSIAPRAARYRALFDAAGITSAGLVLLTGSGSSLYAGECLALGLQEALGVPAQAVSSGQLLTHLDQTLPPDLPCVAVSFARSGDSPESWAALDLLLERRPSCRHLVITCNGHGRLATRYAAHPNVLVDVLDDRTCDRSLVMTSSFTNMVLAGRVLASLDDPDAYVRRAGAVARIGRDLLARHGDAIAALAASTFDTVVYLASGSRLGAAHEASLKLLEMTEGRTPTLADTFLGLRHGPMCSVHGGTLVIGFVSSDRTTRAYEVDLLQELNRKQLGWRRLLVGDGLPREALRPEDVVLDCPGLAALPDDDAALIDVLAGQLLAFFRCLRMGLRPDAPSSDGVITRVVEEFGIHRR
jgi:tagatose-6-phosphate ketose/aldose isomerase